MPKPKDIQATLVELVSRKTGQEAAQITRDASFADDLGMDAKQTMDLFAEFAGSCGLTAAVQQKLVAVAAAELKREAAEIKADAAFTELGAEAETVARLVEKCGEAFEVAVPSEEAERVDTVRTGVRLVYRTLLEKDEGVRAVRTVGQAADYFQEKVIEQTVVNIVVSQLGREVQEVTRETSFINDLGADSLDQVELIMEFDEAFNLSTPEEEAQEIETVGDAIAYIQKTLTRSSDVGSGQ